MAFLDLHNHLLPDVDDGSRSLEETARHLARFRVQGMSRVVFTPHLLVPELGLGQEILAKTPEDLERVVSRTDVGLDGGAPLLVEFGFSPGFDGDGVIRRARAEGRPIIVAHPERYDYGELDGLEEVRRWRDLGALLQVNGGSLAGLYSTRSTVLAWRLLHAGLAGLVCTDHHGEQRQHDPRMIALTLADVMGQDRVEEWLGRGPRRALGIVDPVAA